jgi:hypothetical protein
LLGRGGLLTSWPCKDCGVDIAQFSNRFRKVTTLYPRFVSKAFDRDHAAAMAASDDEVA